MKLFSHIRTHILKGMMRKEFLQLFRDPKMRGVLFASPVLMLIIFGFAVNTDVKNAQLVITDNDHSAQSRAYAEKITSSGYFLLSRYTDNPADAEKEISSGNAEIFIHIPTGFSADLSRGKPVTVQTVIDSTDPNRGMIIFSYLNAINESFSRDFTQKQFASLRALRPDADVSAVLPVAVVPKIYFNENLESRVFFLPGILGLLIGLITIMLTSMSIVKERESGTIEQIIVTPIRPWEFIAGKTIPFALIAFIDIVVITLLMIILFSIPFRGDFIFLLFSGIIYIFACLGIGIYISTVSRTQQQAMLTTFLFLLPAILFSGFVFPVSSMPYPVQVLTRVNPMLYFTTITRGVFLKGIGIVFLWKELTALAVLASGFLFLSIRRFNRGFE